MYINLNVLLHHELDLKDLVNLVLIRQQKFEDNGEYLEKVVSLSDIQYYYDKGWITEIKGKKSNTQHQKLRLTDKGRDLLDALDTPEVTQEDIVLRDWLIEIYNKEEKIIGNKKRITQGLAFFRAYSGITKNKLAFLLKTFVTDENNFKYNQKLENVFFDNSNVFNNRFSLDASRLWQYYLRKKDFFDSKFKQWEEQI